MRACVCVSVQAMNFDLHAQVNTSANTTRTHSRATVETRAKQGDDQPVKPGNFSVATPSARATSHGTNMKYLLCSEGWNCEKEHRRGVPPSKDCNVCVCVCVCVWIGKTYCIVIRAVCYSRNKG